MRGRSVNGKERSQSNGRRVALTGAPVRIATVLLLGFAILASCSWSSREESAGSFELGAEGYAGGLMEKSAAPQPSRSDVSDMTAVSEQAPAAAASAAEADRKRVMSGYARLVVDDVEGSKREVELLAVDSGGYVEAVWETAVVIRVPADDFPRLFDSILELGTVQASSIETLDVTEYYRDLDGRLELAETARERLYVLLEKTEDVEERLLILREIRRLTEEIERIRGTLSILEGRIRYSRIQVDLVPRLSVETVSRSDIPFLWVADLNPLYASIDRLRVGFDLDLAEDFAVFARDRTYRAESAEGVRIRAGTVRNIPKGDTDFWRQALSFHLSPFYVEVREIGIPMDESGDGMKAVLFRSKDAEPFLYFVAVKAIGRWILVFEAFYPNAELHRVMGSEIERALSSAEVGR